LTRVLRTFRASPARSNSPRGGFPQRQVLASASPEVFSPSAFWLRRAIRLCRKPDDPASAIESAPRAILARDRLRSCGFPLAQTAGYSRHACAGPTRIMHRRSPVRRCSATRPDDLATLPASSIRQRSWGSIPFAVLILSTGPTASWRRAPTCRFSSIPPR